MAVEDLQQIGGGVHDKFILKLSEGAFLESLSDFISYPN